MDQFGFYFKWGVDHILTWEALDHILFVAALSLRYLWKDWKKVAIMVTAFTVGHSITLVLSGLKSIAVPVNWIEFLVPLTIAATAIANLFYRDTGKKNGFPLIYVLALFFGLIHGLAYANTLVLEGEEGLVAHLFAFNVGIELAQLLVVAIVLFISFIVVQVSKFPGTPYIRTASVIILLLSLKMAYERIPVQQKNEKQASRAIGRIGRFAIVRLSKQNSVTIAANRLHLSTS